MVIDLSYRDAPGLLTTHIPMLVRAFDLSEGDVLEVGTGRYSTPILNWLCTVAKRYLYSYESSNHWYHKAQRYAGTYHYVIQASNWEQATFDQRHWGMAFIDHSPDGRRPVDIARLANLVDYIVVHDTEPEHDEIYGYGTVWDLFKYRYDHTRLWPNTTVVSNFKDLSNLG